MQIVCDELCLLQIHHRKSLVVLACQERPLLRDAERYTYPYECRGRVRSCRQHNTRAYPYIVDTHPVGEA